MIPQFTPTHSFSARWAMRAMATGCQTTPLTAAKVRAAAERFKSLGAIVEEVSVPEHLTLGFPVWSAIRGDAACVMLLEMNGHGIGYETFLAVYVFAVMLGIASHSPGGLGVFEATILLALASLPREPVLGALLLFRLCYYLAPFILALTLLGAYEVKARMRSANAVLHPEEEATVAEK